MRLARLAAVGLAIGLIAGFVVALLRSRPHAPESGTIPATIDERPAGRQLVAVGGVSGVGTGPARVLELRRRVDG